MNNKAIAYARCSTDIQESSIEQQKKAVETYASQNGLTIIKWFEDEGKSGRNAEKREAFMELMEYVKTCNDFKYVLCYDVSRWGRFENRKESVYWEVVCEKAGKKVKYCTEGYVNDDSIGSYITKVVKDSEASEYSSKLSKTSFRGHRHYAMLGYFVGGGKKYAYARLLLDEAGKPVRVLKDGEHKATKTQRVKLVKGDPEEVKTVQRIYSMYVNDGFGITKICNVLNDAGIPSPKNKGWSKATVWKVLHDETYLGWNVWNRNVNDNLHEKDTGWVKYKPATEWVIHKGSHEPIIDEAVFKAVQAKTRQAYKGGNNSVRGKGRGYYTPYLLSGIMKCVKCGANYQGRICTHKAEKKTYATRYYTCGNYTMKDNCIRWNVPKDIVEDFAIKSIRARINNPEWLASMRGKLEKVIGLMKKESSNDIGKIESELKEVEKQIDNLTDAVSKGFDKDIAISKINELKGKRDRLTVMLSDIKRQTGGNNDNEAIIRVIMARIKDFTTRFDKAEIPMKKSMLADFIRQITVDASEKKVYYYMNKIPDFQGDNEGNLPLVKLDANPHHHLKRRSK